MNGTTPKGGDNEPRPHFVPITDRRRQLLQIEISGFFGHTGLCPGQITPDRSPRTDHPGRITPDGSPRTDHPGQITLEDGSTEYAFRSIALTEED